MDKEWIRNGSGVYGEGSGFAGVIDLGSGGENNQEFGLLV
jgi:hypothetical protein